MSKKTRYQKEKAACSACGLFIFYLLRKNVREFDRIELLAEVLRHLAEDRAVPAGIRTFTCTRTALRILRAGGNADLASTVEGFRIVPYPYLATLTGLPVDGAYDAETLFTLTWNEDGSIATAEPNYEESMLVLEDCFPKDKPIFLMCGGGGYAGMTKSLLIFLGWDPELLYNVGCNWEYQGDHGVELIEYSEDANGNDYFCTWRADYALIDFSRLHPVA